MHNPNHQILLDEITVEFTANEKPVKVQAQLILRMLPKPSFVIELDDLPADIVIDFDNPFLISLENGSEIEVICTTWDTQSKDSVTKNKCVLTSTKGNYSLLRTSEPIHYLEFKILNFPKFFKGQDKKFEGIDDQGKRLRILGAVRLEFNPWMMEVYAVPDLEESQ